MKLTKIRVAGFLSPRPTATQLYGETWYDDGLKTVLVVLEPNRLLQTVYARRDECA